MDLDLRPTPETANDEVALQHASSTRSPLLREHQKGKIGKAAIPRLHSALVAKDLQSSIT